MTLQQHKDILQHNNINSSTSLRQPSIQNSDQYLQDFRIDQKNGGTVVAPNIVGSIIAGDVYVTQVSHFSSINNNETLQSVKNKIKTRMMKDSERILEGSAQQSVSLNKIYTQLFIINDESDPINREHEIWQIETMNDLNTSAQTIINYNEILKPPLDENRTMKIVLTKGIAGIGKTVTVQKFVYDWASGKANQDLEFVFLLPFRELNLLEGKKSLFDLLCDFYPEFKDARSISDWICDRKVLFILDGLDEYKNELSFQTSILSDPAKKDTLDVLLANLLRGKLLPSAHLWITSRPVAAEQLPSEIFRQGYVTQIRGFIDEQKDEYFTRQFEDPDLTQKVICHLSRCILEGFLPRSENSSLEDHKKVTKYIKLLRRKDLSPERCLSLVRCIVELKDSSFLQMPDLESSRTTKPLTLFQCTLLAFRFVMSDMEHDEFVLRKFNITLEGFQRFSPAITRFRMAMLKGSGFTEKHCDILVPLLTSPNSHLTHLDLSHNSLGLSALKQLSRAFCDPKCQIQMLNLSHNDLHSQDMEHIKNVLSGSNVNLKILDLSDNQLEDEGVKIISAGLQSANCHLEVLKLSGCHIKEGVLKLLSSLKASLRELDLQYNDLGNIMEKKVSLRKYKLPSLSSLMEWINIVHSNDLTI
ncbi:hypothetical protein cypCar_00042012 [Cyprinus carpio]|nr:hypothetical protein cypCar_00042012 [Cyprinus carpio]